VSDRILERFFGNEYDVVWFQIGNVVYTARVCGDDIWAIRRPLKTKPAKILEPGKENKVAAAMKQLLQADLDEVQRQAEHDADQGVLIEGPF
jgi:hypothetical protein